MVTEDKEAFVLTLDGEASPRSRRLLQWAYGLLGLSFILQGVARESFGDFFSVVFIGLGFGCLFVVMLRPKIVRPLYLRIDREGIEGRVSYTEKVSFRWDEIARVEGEMFRLIIRMKDGRQTSVDLSALTYKQHHFDKPRLIELIRAKGITVRES